MLLQHFDMCMTVYALTISTLSESYARDALFPVKAVYFAGYICIVQSHDSN